MIIIILTKVKITSSMRMQSQRGIKSEEVYPCPGSSQLLTSSSAAFRERLGCCCCFCCCCQLISSSQLLLLLLCSSSILVLLRSSAAVLLNVGTAEYWCCPFGATIICVNTCHGPVFFWCFSDTYKCESTEASG